MWYAKITNKDDKDLTAFSQGLVIDEVTGKNIAVCYDPKDVNLIAATPKLLQACKDLIQAYEVKMGKSAVRLRIDLARDAVAEAEL